MESNDKYSKKKEREKNSACYQTWLVLNLVNVRFHTYTLPCKGIKIEIAYTHTKK